jgi:hypothetical protein
MKGADDGEPFQLRKDRSLLVRHRSPVSRHVGIYQDIFDPRDIGACPTCIRTSNQMYRMRIAGDSTKNEQPGDDHRYERSFPQIVAVVVGPAIVVVFLASAFASGKTGIATVILVTVAAPATGYCSQTFRRDHIVYQNITIYIKIAGEASMRPSGKRGGFRAIRVFCRNDARSAATSDELLRPNQPF